MILQSQPLVRRAVGRYVARSSGILDADDIFSCGTMGLIDAVDRYDRTRGVKFETYAVTRIRGYLVDQLRAVDWLPRSARANVRLVRNAAIQLEECLGRKPALSEVSTTTGLSGPACKQALIDDACKVVSLEDLAPDADGAKVASTRQVEDGGALDPEAAVVRHELRSHVARALRALPPRERAVVRLKYVNDWSCRQIAAQLGVSESRVSQLHSQGLARMRLRLTAEFGSLSGDLCIA